jgi:hypothetical protein
MAKSPIMPIGTNPSLSQAWTKVTTTIKGTPAVKPMDKLVNMGRYLVLVKVFLLFL